MEDAETSPSRNYVNAWLTESLTARILGATRNSGAVATRLQWFPEQNLVQAVVINKATGAVESTLFSVPAESVSEARFEGNTFKLTVGNKPYRFLVADDAFTPDAGIGGSTSINRGGALGIVFDPALDDLRGLRSMLESHNVAASGIRIIRSILIGLGISFGLLAALILFVYLAYVK